MSRFVRDKVESLGPLRTFRRVNVGPDDATLRRTIFDHRRKVDGTNLRYGLHHLLAQRRLVIGVDFVNVESVRFPIFMQAERQIEVRLLVEPGNVRANLG